MKLKTNLHGYNYILAQILGGTSKHVDFASLFSVITRQRINLEICVYFVGNKLIKV